MAGRPLCRGCCSWSATAPPSRDQSIKPDSTPITSGDGRDATQDYDGFPKVLFVTVH